MKQSKRTFWFGLAISLLFLMLAAAKPAFIESLEMKTYDLRMQLRADDTPDPDIVILDIDDESVARLGHWPLPRYLLAHLIDKVSQGQPKLIGLNFVFSEPNMDEYLKLGADKGTGEGPGKAAAGIPSLLTEIKAREEQDAMLAESITRAGNVVLPVFFDFGTLTRDDDRPKDVEPILSRQGLNLTQQVDQDFILPAAKVTSPAAIFSNAAARLGHANVILDPDGTVRREVLVINYKGIQFPAYSLNLALMALRLDREKVTVNPPEGLLLHQDLLPTNPNLDFFISYKKRGAFPRVTFNDVIHDKIDSAVFKNKIVLIGASAAGIITPESTPIEGSMPSNYIAANALSNILLRNYVRRHGLVDLVELLMVALIGLYITVILPRIRGRNGALTSAVILAGVVLAGVYLFIGPGLWIKITYMVLLIVIGATGVIALGGRSRSVE